MGRTVMWGTDPEKSSLVGMWLGSQGAGIAQQLLRT